MCFVACVHDVHVKQIPCDSRPQMFWQLSVRTDKSGHPVCLIAYDTDYPKRGIHTENTGRIFSYVSAVGLLVGYYLPDIMAGNKNSCRTINPNLTRIGH